MRHLRVPSHEIESTLSALRASGWMQEGGRILVDGDPDFRLIPLAQSAPESLPIPLGEWLILDAEAPSPTPRSYRDHLDDFLDDEIVNAHTDWPTGHETMGDLIVVKLDESIIEFGEEIAQAMLTHHARIRLVLRDDGVKGEFRVRSLIPLAARTEGGEILGVSKIPSVGDLDTIRLLSTHTQVRESGYSLQVNPTLAYFSSRLSTEREVTLAAANKLRKILGKPLRVCDPYAGVGPSLIPLLNQPGLVGEVFASDLNPDAVGLLEENLLPFSGNCEINTECCDATTLATRDSETSMEGHWDMLLVNIPHSALEHLPKIIPLLAKGKPSLLRAWAVIDAGESVTVERELLELLSEHLSKQHGGLSMHARRSYSTTAQLYRIEVWLHL